MQANFQERQTPPQLFLKLVQSLDPHIRKEFLSKALQLNNLFSFASIQSERQHDLSELGGRHDTCKYNGNYFALNVYI